MNSVVKVQGRKQHERNPGSEHPGSTTRYLESSGSKLQINYATSRK